jgi:vesicular inhibitory amino acid transporter
VNSLDNFARSWTRAAAYPEIAPTHGSLVSAHFRDEEEPASSSAIDDGGFCEDAEVARYLAAAGRGPYPSIPQYGSISTGLPRGRFNEPATRHITDLFAQKQASRSIISVDSTLDKEREPLLVATVTTEAGKVEHIIVGQSTLPQTVFNSVNVLIGIGLLSLPLGIRYSGWSVVPLCPVDIGSILTGIIG